MCDEPVSVDLIESEQLIILEKVYNEKFDIFEYVKPTITTNDESEIVAELSILDEPEFFFYDITLDDDKNYYIDKQPTEAVQGTYNSTFTDKVINGATYTSIPSTYRINQLKEDYETINIGFSSPDENSFIGTISLYIQTNLEKVKFAEINLFVDTVAEDDRLPLLLTTLGQTINNKDYLIFDTTDVKEDEIDFNIINKKRKELLLAFHNIFPFLGSYKALINIIKFFGYESLAIKEYWLNVNLNSENYGKYRPIDIEDVLNNSNNTEELSDLFPSQVYKKTNKMGLYYQITEETGEVDQDGLPLTQDTFQFTLDEILIKLYALKEKLQKYFLPLNTKIIDIVGEALYYTKIELNYWTTFNRIDNININITPTFEASETYGFIEDLRPLEWIGAKIGNDLKVDGTTNLLVREFTLTNSFFDNTLQLIDTVSGVNATIVADYQSTDESNTRALYLELIKLGDPFDKFYINLDGNKILLVEKEPTDTNIVGVVETGRYASTPPSLTFVDFFNGNNSIDSYGNAYMSYFFDSIFNLLNLSNNENIPVGHPLVLTNTSFEVTWDDLELSWNQLDPTRVYNDFNLPSDPGFPTARYDNANDQLTGVNWDNIGGSNFYELEWFIYKEADENSDYWSNSFKSTIEGAKNWAVILPFVGTYSVELTLYDLYGSYSRKTKHDYITIEQKNPNFTVWKFKDLDASNWDSLDLTWDDMNSSWDLPYLPNTITDDAIIAWYSIDRVEFYQNLVKQNAIYGSVFDINSYRWDNIPFDINWDDMDHLYWNELSPTFTKFYISGVTGATFGISVYDENNVYQEGATFSRNLAIDNIYHDFIDQVYELTEDENPILSSYRYDYTPVLMEGEPKEDRIMAVSKDFSKPLKDFFFGFGCQTSNYNSIINGYGALGDSPASFDIYSNVNIQSGTTGATSSIEIGDVTYNIPTDISTLEDLHDDLVNNSPFGDWNFNIVTYGGTGVYTGESFKIIATKVPYNSYDNYTIKYYNAYGTKTARSITTNATWNSLDVIYYQTDIRPMTQLYFNYDISLMPGFKNPVWTIRDSKTNELVFTWENKYLVYLFTNIGEYNVSLQLEDTNGNIKTITKNGIVRVTEN
jgi:hypothetical protein